MRRTSACRSRSRTRTRSSRQTNEERVYDIAWSGSRTANADGKLPAVGNTVNVETATCSNSIGAPALQGFWKDPDFDPRQRAFYYVRVLKIPTPSWLVYDHVAFGVDIRDGKTVSRQERAYTSPVWYTPLQEMRP